MNTRTIHRLDMRSIEDQLDAMKQELADFPRSERYEALRRKFWKRPATVLEFITPRWTLEKSALALNWEIEDSEVRKCTLHHFERRELALSLHRPEVFRFPGNWRAMDEDKALMILSHWLEERQLTPPVLTLRADGTWGKRDGFHRLVLAMMCALSTIPIWVLEDSSPLHF